MPELWGSWCRHSRILKFWFHSQKGSRARIYENGYNQQITIAKAKRLKLAAEEKAAAQELLEITILLEAAKHGDDFASLDPETAISIAWAVWDTLLAEEHLAVSRVQECEVIPSGGKASKHHEQEWNPHFHFHQNCHTPRSPNHVYLPISW